MSQRRARWSRTARRQESNVYQRTVDYTEEFANGHYAMLDIEVLVTVRWD